MPSSSPPTRREIFLSYVNHTLNCVSIAAVFAIHFLLSVAVLITSHGNYLPYVAFYNGIFFVTLFWSVESLKPGPLQMATVANLVSIVFDIIVAANVYGPVLLVIILSLIFRPVTSIVLLRKSFQRKRRFNLHQNESTTLGMAIRALLYNSQQPNGEDLERPYGKDPLPSVLSTLPVGQSNRQPAQQQETA